MNVQTRFLAQTPFFNGCSTEALALFAQRMHPVILKKGTILFREGEDDASWYLIEEGEIGLYRKARSGVRMLLAELGPGEAFGEMSFLENHARMSSAIARKDAQLLRLNGPVFHQLLDDADPIALRMLRAMSIAQSRRLREMTGILQDITDTGGASSCQLLRHPLDVNTIITSGSLLE